MLPLDLPKEHKTILLCLPGVACLDKSRRAVPDRVRRRCGWGLMYRGLAFVLLLCSQNIQCALNRIQSLEWDDVCSIDFWYAYDIDTGNHWKRLAVTFCFDLVFCCSVFVGTFSLCVEFVGLDFDVPWYSRVSMHVFVHPEDVLVVWPEGW